MFFEAMYFGHFPSFCTMQLEPPKILIDFYSMQAPHRTMSTSIEAESS